MVNIPPALILECANAHGGSFDLLKSTVEAFKKVVYPNKHIKFQPFHPEKIALPDYAWYTIYQELHFRPDQWNEIILDAATAYEGVWLDIFDSYGSDVFAKNANSISGIKLQASVLENQEIFSALEKIDISGKYLLLNVSGYDITEIESFVETFSLLRVTELILQIGYQSYPTSISDTAIQKAHILRAAFPGIKICLADHLSAEDDLVSIVPVLGLAAGCDLIEKHICLDRSVSKYDHYSALEPVEVQILANRILGTTSALRGKFVSGAEANYLAKSIQIPVAAKPLPAGSMTSPSDIVFRRTAQSGSTLRQLTEVQQERRILASAVDSNATISIGQFRPARIGVIVACRMKSSRLVKKATLPIAGVASVERCLQNCLEIPWVEQVVLATSTIEEDAVLENYTLNGLVKFWRGDAEDVIQRYLGACETFGIDVIIRVTADCPVISPEIARVLIEHHFRSGADYTAAQKCAVGTACEIYNTEALRRVIKHLGKAEYSEYMTWYLQNNKHIFKVELVKLPEEYIRDYRLTLDYPEDLEVFEKLYTELKQRDLPMNIKNMYAVLDERPDISAINSHLTLRYREDQVLIEKLNRVTKIHV